jgi:tetrahydromethanopterin S-methyltransferase subunit G
MALHAAAVEILIEKGKFEPDVALGIAEAIEASIMHAQFVTVPILDARLQELRADMRIGLMSLETKSDGRFGELKAKIDRRCGELDAKIDRRFGELDAKIDQRCGELDAKIDHRCGQLEAKIERRFGELETKMERTKAELIRWVFLVMLGNVALSAGAAAVLNALQHLG